MNKIIIYNINIFIIIYNIYIIYNNKLLFLSCWQTYPHDLNVICNL